MSLTLSWKDYNDLRVEAATAEFVTAIIEDYARREIDQDCKKVLKEASDYFRHAAESRRCDLRNFSPLPEPVFSQQDQT